MKPEEMTDWNNLRTFKTKQFRVTVDWTWEEYPDLSWDETGEVLTKCESGEWGVYLFRVQVTYRGDEIGRDYLGNSVYADPADFATEHRHGGGACFPDMVRTAIAEARHTLTRARPYIRTAA
jgi:hypothetical protein